jgi:hypothetical protein
MNINDISLSRAAIIAAISLLIMAIIAPIADFAIIQKLVVPCDGAQTIANLRESEGLFRLSIVFFLLVGILDIIVAWALYVFLIPVNKSLSLLTAWMRIIYASILIIVSLNLINIVELINNSNYLSAFGTVRLQAIIMLSFSKFRLGWETGLIVFSIHLLLLGLLIYKAGYMRRILGVLLIIASSGYFIDGIGKLLSPDYNLTISMFTFIGEVILIFWLLIKGRKIGNVNINHNMVNGREVI